jgi:NAD(P)-dependent dehydrogenase (short-subunit alcohol dehydrogenase family)
MTYWTNKVVMITGASSGIGKGIALEIARGAQSRLLARREDLLNEIVARRRRERQGCCGCGRARCEGVREAADRFRRELGPIDILIANAGIGTADHARVDTEHAANVIEHQRARRGEQCGGSAAGDGRAQAGTLVAISSLAAYRGLAKSAAYCASKAAMSSYFESLRIDLRTRGVGVTIIHPGFIKTT